MVTRIGLSNAKPIRAYFREWREWKGWTQQELADKLGTTAATVSRIENGERDWSKGYLESFSHVIECPEPIDPIRHPPGTHIDLNGLLNAAPPEMQQQAISVL